MFCIRCGRHSRYFRPSAADVLKTARGERVVRKIRKPPNARIACETRIGLAPSVNQSVADVAGRQLQTFFVHIREKLGGGGDFRAMLGDERGIVRVIEIARQERKRQAELRRLGTAHVDHAARVDEVGVIVIENGFGLRKASPFKIRVQRAGENILEAVVLGAVIIAIHRAIFRIITAGPYHEFLCEGMLGHIQQ